jgi:hypothetical protein
VQLIGASGSQSTVTAVSNAPAKSMITPIPSRQVTAKLSHRFTVA